MPQPLSLFHPTLGYVLAAGNLPHSPEMAHCVTGVIGFWSQIEMNLSNLLATITEADPITTMAMYNAVKSADAQRAMLLAAADVGCSPEDSRLIIATLDRFKTARKQRNAFAHHLWGSLNTRPDCVLLCEPSASVAYQTNIKVWVGNHGEGPRPEMDRSKLMVWRQPDFDRALADAQQAHAAIARLPFVVQEGPSRDQMREALLSDIQIRSHYDRLARQNDQQPQR